MCQRQCHFAEHLNLEAFEFFATRFVYFLLNIIKVLLLNKRFNRLLFFFLLLTYKISFTMSRNLTLTQCALFKFSSLVMQPIFFFDKLFCRKFCPGGTHANTETFQIKKFFPPGKLAIKSLLLCDFSGGALLPIILRRSLAKGSDYTS